MHDKTNQIPRPSSPVPGPALPITPPSSPFKSKTVRDNGLQTPQQSRASRVRRDLEPRTPPTSPHTPPDRRHTGEQEARRATFSAIETLKKCLPVHRKECAAVAESTKTACKITLPARNISQFDEILARISDNLKGGLSEQTLNDLVTLALCHIHKGRPRSTLDKVSRLLFTAPSIDTPSWLVAKVIQSIVPELRATCLSNGHSPYDTTSMVGGRNVHITREILKRVTEPDIFRDDFQLRAYLEVLGESMFCGLHREEEAPGRVAEWFSEIRVICPSIESNPAVHPAKDFRADIAAIKRLEHRRCDLTGYEISPFIHEPPGKSKGIQNIKNALKPKSGPAKGHVYAYEVEGNAGLVKIGYSKNTVQVRLDQHALVCNRLPKKLFPLSESPDREVDHPLLVEALCHAELSRFQTKVDCEACLRKHEEWFNVSPESAIVTLQKWSGWMDRTKSKSNWRQALEKELNLRDTEGLLMEIYDNI
ncbi:GIY-YIG nuclease family protein [Aspergillus brunneoviolaceus CBS 621.78]|uniref:DUF1766-domain-containing protein n=1 Tax=Aspergillus brunneoviolaceus CBS 621.78 TaxID=1450534 RepID=A0ACD1GAE3_9EURO|nr:DUF1766-domain-containing protein [Aspergillus brunneoviolaceus CBS 621.78]RAH46213.1 DUF1766-domain-containing protein [Aspergillus brunneoviolaceus CBS 621.78]